ncbi:MAG: hypothetical protein GEU98_00350 [Pseudonocardiaceae bacterium]|nr:hypothetical protein [Pseudonocardiaceae bacterium]
MVDNVDWARWPLIEVAPGDVPTAQVAPAVARALQAAVDRGEYFAAVVHMPDMPANRPRVSGAPERIRMLRKLRPGLSRRCRGLAFVMSAAAQRDNVKVVKSGNKIWGCPTMATDDVQRARASARTQLSADTSEPA